MIKMRYGLKGAEESAELWEWGTAEEMAKELGLDLRELEEMWHVLDVEEGVTILDLLREGYKPDICENVLIIVDGRPFSERCKCFRKGDVAYVTDEEFARML